MYECLFWCALHIGGCDPCIASTGAASEFVAALVAGDLTAIHALKPPPLGGCFLQKKDQTPEIRQLHDPPAATGAYLPVRTLDGCFLECHDGGSFFIGGTEKLNQRALDQW